MQNFLTPVLALIIWTFVMWVWMYKRRIPAMMAITKNTQEFIDKPELKDKIPARVKWAAENYNHLHEQPVVFYALMFYLFLSNLTPSWILYAAWGYVIVRVLHSLSQVIGNRIMVRFPLFVLGSVLLMAMGVYAAGHAVGFWAGSTL